MGRVELARLALLCAAAVLLAAGGGLAATRVDSGVVRTSAVVDGVPVDLVRPAERSTEPAPAVVVAHGYAGSRQLMADWATTLARSGFVVAQPDFAGHGANRTPLPEDPAAQPRLDADLAAAIGLLQRAPDVDPDRIGLVGHSMGAAAVHRFAADHPAISATVAISLPGSGPAPRDPTLPADLLLLTGQHEFPPFHRAAEIALRAGHPEAEWGTSTGNPGAGNARRGISVHGTEHITILFAPQAHAETARWLQSSLHGTGAPNGNAAGERILPAALLLIAFAVGFIPLVRWLHGRAAPPAMGPPPPVRRIAGAALAGLPLAVLGSAAAPAGWSSLQVGGEVGLFLALFGIGAGSVFALLDRRRAPAATASSVRRSLAVTCYAVLAIAVPIGSGLAEPVPHGPRWWWAPLVVGGCALACCAAEFLTLRLRGARRDVVRAAVLGTGLLGTLAAASAGVLPSFVVLIAPLLGVLLLWHLAWTAVLTRTNAPWWLPAVLGGVLLGWPLAAVSPLV